MGWMGWMARQDGIIVTGRDACTPRLKPAQPLIV
jgi:hypothetical protein